MRDGIAAALGFRKIEAAQLVVEDSREVDAQRRVAGRNGLREGECGLLLIGIEAHRSLLLAVLVYDTHTLEFELVGIQRDGAGGLLDVDVNHFIAGERGGLEIGHEIQRIVRGNDVRREALRVGGVRKTEKKTEDCGKGA